MQDAQKQLLAAQSEAAQIAKAKARMEVETLRIQQRIEILNNISTQATLLAGSSIAFLGGEALETVDDKFFFLYLATCGKFLYVGSGALALITSLWVIVISSHLVALTRDASLRKNILKASMLLDEGLKEVRSMHLIAMASLLLACLSGALLNMDVHMSLLVTIIFVFFSVQIFFKMQYLSLSFFRTVELEMDVADQLTLPEIARAWLEPLRPHNMKAIQEMWQDHNRREEEHMNVRSRFVSNGEKL
jgi:hypothetical protein